MAMVLEHEGVVEDVGVDDEDVALPLLLIGEEFAVVANEPV